MSNVLKVALPGFNAQTDTNPDHFALDSTVDNILIKEKNRGSITLSAGNSQTVAHNLGYIPFFIVYAYGSFIINGSNKTGYLQCSSGGAVSVPIYEAVADTTNVYITNNSGSSVTFWYYIFYDQQL